MQEVHQFQEVLMIIFINSNLKISTKVILLLEEGELIKQAVISLKNQFAKNVA